MRGKKVGFLLNRWEMDYRRNLNYMKNGRLQAAISKRGYE